MQQKVLYIGALLLICGLVKSDELSHDNDNYYLNGLSIEQEQPIGSRREGDYYDAYPGQSHECTKLKFAKILVSNDYKSIRNTTY